MERSQRRAAWVAGTGILAVLTLSGALLYARLLPAAMVIARPPVPTAPPAVTLEVPTVPPVLVPQGATAAPTPPGPAPTPTSTVQPDGHPAADTVAFTPVTTYRAAVVVEVGQAEETDVRQLLGSLEGVVHVAGITVTASSLGGVPADIAQVDHRDFRQFTPEATANSEPLWDRIVAGDVAVTHEFGTTHQVELGTQLVTGEAGPLRVGAFATNGTPPVADAIVAFGTPVGEGARRLLVALAQDASPAATVEALQAQGVVAEAIPDPRAPRDDIVIPVGGITPENVWDHLALCESSGDWQINTGNGYYGGVQFLPESWALVGGTGLPHEHPREEQIHRATLLWQIQGWEAWPQCARRLGLIVDPE